MNDTPQWVLVKLVPQADGKVLKLPVDYRTGKVGDAHDPTLWLPRAMAESLAADLGCGIGFVFTAADPYCFIDGDHVRTGAGWSPAFLEMVQGFAGAYMEVSQSGEGLHIICRYTGPEPAHKPQPKGFPGGIYTSKRFAHITGTGARGDADADRTAAVHGLIARFPGEADPAAPAPEWTTGPCAEWRGPADDEVLIGRMLRSRSAAATFGGKASAADLWEANAGVLAGTYPPDSNSGDAYNASEADAALAAHLMFWTGKDCARTQRLMLRSDLARDKWGREDYLPRTILNALRMARDVLVDRAPEPPPAPAPDPSPSSTSPGAGAATSRPVTGETFLGPDAQRALFAGCVYVLNEHKVLIPGGHLVRPDQFRARFGGYTFAMDNANQRTVRNAWEAFTESQVLRCPQADDVCFKPGHAPGAIVEGAANTYWPCDVPRKMGDAGPFLEHMRRILPNDRDRAIMLNYMAAIVQHKGVKFQWAPVVLGVQGNGKTLLSRCVAEAIGPKYTHSPRAAELSEKFNTWLFNRIFVPVEDIYVPEHKAEIMQILKPMITSERQERRAMNRDQQMMDCCANFIFNTNHPDALKFDDEERRYCWLLCAQQGKGDLARDGMNGDYFPNLYAWLRGDGYAIVSELLHTMPIDPALNPAGECQRAPESSTIATMRENGHTGVEQEVEELIASGEPGFKGGWVSSYMLGVRLRNLGYKVTPRSRLEILAKLGYVRHPGLPDGRCHNAVSPDNSKPRLFVRPDHGSVGLTGGAVSQAYQAAQAGAAAVMY